MSWNPIQDRRARSLVVLALLALGCVAGVEYMRWRAAADASTRSPAAGTRIAIPPPEAELTAPVDPADLTY